MYLVIRTLSYVLYTTSCLLPVYFLPHVAQFGGADILHIYNRGQVKTRLNASGLYLANNKPGGFFVEVTNTLASTMVMVGVRVLLGSQSLEKVPSFIEVFGRTHPVSFPAGMSRWVDVPFAREESLQADKTLTINCKYAHSTLHCVHARQLVADQFYY